VAVETMAIGLLDAALKWEDVGFYWGLGSLLRSEYKMNVQHRTSNVQHRMKNSTDMVDTPEVLALFYGTDFTDYTVFGL